MHVLYRVVTIHEAAAMWDKHPLTVRRSINASYRPLVARKSGKVWLISFESCERRWGPPIRAHSA